MEQLIEMFKAKLGEDVMTEDVISKFKAEFDLAVAESVKTKVADEVDVIKEEKEQLVLEFKDDILATMKEYFNRSMTEFVAENTVAMEAEFKVEMAEKYMKTAMDAFQECYVTIPEEKVDVVKSLEAENNDIKDKYNQAVNESIEKDAQILEYEKSIAFMEMTDKLTDVQKEEVKSVLEMTDVKSLEDYKAKAGVLIERFASDSTDNKEDVIEEKFESKEEKIEEKKEDKKEKKKYLV
ncbi:hypothetical protein [uncultured Arcobacter sp.]|uniref:hypothetical protein n=1 Tax=uncultured Arcobacter sp. TaxID=165434 RepID=UPI00260E68F4|nr:hypothetical protein [uncultured Arcobacter sp.]